MKGLYKHLISDWAVSNFLSRLANSLEVCPGFIQVSTIMRASALFFVIFLASSSAGAKTQRHPKQLGTILG